MGHIQDLWFTTVTDPAGRPERVKTRLHGTGKRYRVRYTDPEGRERSRCFADGCKKQAQDALGRIENDKRAGEYYDPAAGTVTFETYARSWLATQTFEESTREVVALRLRKHITPHLGARPLSSITPEHIRSWVKTIHDQGLAPNHQLVLFTHVQTILNAAVADGRLRTNPCAARSVTKPRVPARKLLPWPADRVHAVRDALPDRYRVTVALGAGCGLRQGEVFGLAPTDIHPDTATLNVTRQVKIVGGVLCFGPPKRGRTRTVPLPDAVLAALTAHQQIYPPRTVTLPWRHPSGEPVSVELIVHTPWGGAVRRSTFGTSAWAPALRKAGVTPAPRIDGFHALRHFYASTLLHSGESIVALADYLGHADPGFTLRTYTHLMPTSHQRTRTTINELFDGTTTA